MLSFECIKNEKSVYFLLTSAFCCLIWTYRKSVISDAQKIRKIWAKDA